jgi:hypothetical protein
MNRIPPLLLLVVFFALTIGLPFGLYALLTRDRRRSMREIREGAVAQGWRYRLRRWQGNPTAFRIDGATRGGRSWIMTSGSTRGYDKGWSVVAELRVPTLGGEVDLAVLPREAGRGNALLRSAIPAGAKARVAAFSGAIGSAVELFQDTQELPSGLPAFDARYEVLVRHKQFQKQPVDAALGQRALSWPADAVAPHSMLAWRDPFGLHLQARLPGPPNWSTVSYLASLGEDLCARVPAPQSLPASPTLFDRAVARILRP